MATNVANPQEAQLTGLRPRRTSRPILTRQKASRNLSQSKLPLPIALKAASMITFVGFIIFFIPYAGSLKTTYGLFLLSSVIFSLLIWRSISEKKEKKIGTQILSILGTASPVIFVIIQIIVILSILRNTNIMDSRDPSGNLPDMLTHYKYATFALTLVQMVLLSVWTNMLISGPANKGVLSEIENNISALFVILGILNGLFISLLYVVITRFLTDG